MSEKHICCGSVWRGYGMGDDRCGRGAAYEHAEKWYCKTHHPPTVEAKRAASQAEFQRQWAEERETKNKEAAAAVENQRRADLYPELLAMLTRVLNAGAWYTSAIEIDTYPPINEDGEKLEQEIRTLIAKATTGEAP